jgi:class 3 adenylate cyclase
MLFADVAGFSGLPETDLPDFFLAFLGVVHEALRGTERLFANTWGDGLYIVFEGVVPCADFALGLLRRLGDFDFARFHFPQGKEPGVRVGLHTGPVFKGFDPILQRDNYFGSHVSRAARIEPVTAPGCAFVSEQFAAALAVTPGHRFACEYLGLQPLAKGYDVCPLYRLTAPDDPARWPASAAPAP